MNKIQNFKLEIVILIIFVPIIVLFCTFSLAKIYESTVIKTDAQIAEPILIIEKGQVIEMSTSNSSGTYNFKIKNYNKEGKITEVDLKYYIEIISKGNNIINFELYQNGEKISLENNKTEYIEISKEQKEEREYKIEMKLKSNKLEEYENISDQIKVRFYAEQINKK